MNNSPFKSNEEQDAHLEKIRRQVLGGEDGVAAPLHERLDPRDNKVIVPEACPKCGASEQFVDPWSKVINNQPARGLRCDECEHFWVPGQA